jgi:hypothetical protein
MVCHPFGQMSIIQIRRTTRQIKDFGSFFMPRLLPLALVLLLATPAIAGDIYTWRDKDGRVQYSDMPPPGVDARSIKAQPSFSGDSDSSWKDKDRAFEERQKVRTDAAKKSADEASQAAAQKQRCDEQKSRLESFQIGGRLAKMENGQRVIIPDEERLAEIERMKSEIAQSCK